MVDDEEELIAKVKQHLLDCDGSTSNLVNFMDDEVDWEAIAREAVKRVLQALENE